MQIPRISAYFDYCKGLRAAKRPDIGAEGPSALEHNAAKRPDTLVNEAGIWVVGEIVNARTVTILYMLKTT